MSRRLKRRVRQHTRASEAAFNKDTLEGVTRDLLALNDQDLNGFVAIFEAPYTRIWTDLPAEARFLFAHLALGPKSIRRALAFFLRLERQEFDALLGTLVAERDGRMRRNAEVVR